MQSAVTQAPERVEVSNNELAQCAGVSVAQLTDLLEGRVGGEIANRIGVPVAALDAFINGGPDAAIESPFGDITPAAAFAVGRRVLAIGIILRMLLVRRS
jgi:hypothetical protein